MMTFILKTPYIMKTAPLFFGTSLLLACVLLAPADMAAQAGKKPSARLTLLAQCLNGQFDSAEMAEQDATYFNVTLHCMRIWSERTDGYWLYIEQGLTKMPLKPYRQRVYHLHQTGRNHFQSDVYEIKHPQNYINKFSAADFRQLTLDSIEQKTGCTVYLQYSKKVFRGNTQKQDCPSELKGASYATSEVQIFADKIISWDRGYNAEGKQVWGAQKGGYVFLRRKLYPF